MVVAVRQLTLRLAAHWTRRGAAAWAGTHKTTRQTKFANAGHVGLPHRHLLGRIASVVAIHRPWSL
jgi:hypothetical protein